MITYNVTMTLMYVSIHQLNRTITTEYRKEGDSMGTQIDDAYIRDIQEGLERILEEIMKEGNQG